MTPAGPLEPLYGTQLDYRILEGMDDAILVINEDSRIIWMNPAGRRILSPCEEDPEQKERVRDLTGRILSAPWGNEKIREFECSLKHPGGGERRYCCSGWRTPAERELVIRIRESPDIGDYEAIVEYTGTATILIEEDTTISVANTEFERLSGYARTEIIGIKQLPDFIATEDERRRIMEYHTLRRKDPLAAPKNYSVLFIDRAGNTHTVEVTIGLIPGTFRSVMSLLDVTGRDRAEQALRESEERLNLALSAANDGLVDWDIRTDTIFYSPRCFTMLGYEPGEFVPTYSAILALIHLDDRGRIEMALAGMIAGERDRLDMEIRMKTASGEWAYVLDRLQVVKRDAEGRPLRIAGTHSDITERKKAERDLLIHNMAIASSPNAFVIADLDRRLTYANQAFLSMWGYASDTEIIGKSVMDLWRDRDEGDRVFQTIVETDGYTAERIGRKRDGTIFHVTFSGTLVRDNDGTPLCIAASLNDITDLKRAEAEIQARNRDLSILNRIISVSTSAMDIDEALEKVLTETLTLLDLRGGGIYLIEPDKQSVRLVCAKNLPEVFPLKASITDITAPYLDVLMTGTPLFLDNHLNLSHPEEGDEKPCPCASIPIVAHGKIIGSLNVVSKEGRQFPDADRSLFISIGREVGTSIGRAILIRQLETAEQEANLYLDILGHDIRNVGNVSGLYADLLVGMLDGERKEYAQKLQASIRKSIDILRNVSTIRRIHKESTVLAPVDLDRVIRDEIGIYPGNRIHYGGTDLAVMADALLPEVFANLIGNAVKFGGPEVEIVVRVEESDGEVRVSIEDTGPGILDEMKETIFTRFSRRKGRKSGQGLGLYITRMLITRYGGRIRVDDRVPGRPECGAVFRLTLKKV